MKTEGVCWIFFTMADHAFLETEIVLFNYVEQASEQVTRRQNVNVIFILAFIIAMRGPTAYGQTPPEPTQPEAVSTPMQQPPPTPAPPPSQTPPTQRPEDQPKHRENESFPRLEPEEFDWAQVDDSVLRDTYQSSHFTYLYKGALLRRSLAAQGIKFLAAEVEPFTIGYDGYLEPVLYNLLRSIPAAVNEVFRDKNNQYDGHFADVARIHLASGHYITCVATISRLEVDTELVWIRNSPCEPKWGTTEGWAAAKSLDSVGFYNLLNRQYEKTPHVGVSPESFRTRHRTK